MIKGYHLFLFDIILSASFDHRKVMHMTTGNIKIRKQKSFICECNLCTYIYFKI